MIFIYCEYGRYSLLVNKRQYFIIKYWFKILNCNENKYIEYIYKMMLADIEEYPNKIVINIKHPETTWQPNGHCHSHVFCQAHPRPIISV